MLLNKEEDSGSAVVWKRKIENRTEKTTTTVLLATSNFFPCTTLTLIMKNWHYHGWK